MLLRSYLKRKGQKRGKEIAVEVMVQEELILYHIAAQGR
jgi:hypothetical protein